MKHRSLGMFRVGSAALAFWSISTFLMTGTARAEGENRGTSSAQTYEEHAARAHPDRYPNELTDAEWKTVMLQMRVRAPLTARDHRKILKYLQENN